MARKKKNEKQLEKKTEDIIVPLQEPKVSNVARLRALKSAQKARKHANKK